MASRWAVKPDEKDLCTSSTALPCKSSKDWLAKREDLFSGQATVQNTSLDLLKATTIRSDKAASKSGKDVVSSRKAGKQLSAAPTEDRKGGGNPTCADPTSASCVKRKEALLTGANLLAVGGDNGWGDRGKKEQILKRDLSDATTGRDLPPHLFNGSMLASIQKEPLHDSDSGYGLSPESSRQQCVLAHQAFVEKLSQTLHYESDSTYLLEAIARMERENIGMMPHANEDYDTMEDGKQRGEEGAYWK